MAYNYIPTQNFYATTNNIFELNENSAIIIHSLFVSIYFRKNLNLNF